VTGLIYIGGYGRSGSTLLESLLSARPDILACGEVVSCLRDRIDRGCTCGKARQDCDVWGPFYTTPSGPRDLNHAALTLALLDRASGQFDLVVDSSKTAWGSLSAPFTLRRALSEQFHLIHVVRDPRGVCWSNAGGTKKRGGVVKLFTLRHLRTALGWWVANLACELFRWLHPARYRRLRYEDFTRSPAEALETLFAGLPHEHTSDRTPTGGNRHQLYGNQTRYKGFAPDKVREDVRWKMQMSSGQRALVAALTWPLRLRYGY